ncbi:MAG: hypothetical protein V3V19_11090 [Cocleimonas sp.]
MQLKKAAKGTLNGYEIGIYQKIAIMRGEKTQEEVALENEY